MSITLHNPFRDGSLSEQPAAPCVLVIFGGTGDLARRKLLPALARHFEQGTLKGRCAVVGVSPDTSVTDDSYRDLSLKALSDAGLDKTSIELLNDNLYFQSIGKGSKEDYACVGVAVRLDLDSAGSVTDSLIVLGSVGPTAFRAAGAVRETSARSRAPRWRRSEIAGRTAWC